MKVYSPWKNVDWLFGEWRQAPGSDGFPVEFYTTFWDILGSDLVRTLNLLMSTVVDPSHNAVNLLFKKGDRLQTIGGKLVC